jgi:hypothetical protein
MGTSLLLLQAVGTTASPAVHPNPRLDAIGRYILDSADTQLVVLSILGLMFVLWLTGACVTKKFARFEDVFKASVAVLTMVSGATIAVVFLFTNPPAFEKLTGESRWLPAAVTLAFTAKLGIEEIHNTFFKKK